MSDFAAMVLATIVFKTLIAMSGITCITLGYRLFCQGVFNQAGDITARHDQTSLTIKNGSPGTVLAVLGASLLGTTAWRGIHFDYVPNGNVVVAPVSVTHDLDSRIKILEGNANAIAKAETKLKIAKAEGVH